MCSPRKKKKGLTQKKMTPKSGRRLESPGGPMAVRTTNFVHISSLQINMAHLMKTTFALDRVSLSLRLNVDVLGDEWQEFDATIGFKGSSTHLCSIPPLDKKMRLIFVLGQFYRCTISSSC